MRLDGELADVGHARRGRPPPEPRGHVGLDEMGAEEVNFRKTLRVLSVILIVSGLLDILLVKEPVPPWVIGVLALSMGVAILGLTLGYKSSEGKGEDGIQND